MKEAGATRRRDRERRRDRVARPDGETETTRDRTAERAPRETSSHDRTERRDDRTGWTCGDETIGRRDETERPRETARPGSTTETEKRRPPRPDGGASTGETGSHDRTERRDDRTGWTCGDETIGRRDETERQFRFWALIAKCLELNPSNVHHQRTRSTLEIMAHWQPRQFDVDATTATTTSNGVTKSIIDLIPVFKYNNVLVGVENKTECAVCLGEFKADETLRLLPKCNHAFHLPCIDAWLQSNKTCPLCRVLIVHSMPVANDTSTTSNENHRINMA
ncbi:hypothetical protein Sjap_010615 [Stephania japonica]|uniref:RING-type E3 ubiquitin transferase n=1 Tax=Stephania japonica TaxID=461633 RepID=A0AAP0JBX6_9MAGN